MPLTDALGNWLGEILTGISLGIIGLVATVKNNRTRIENIVDELRLEDDDSRLDEVEEDVDQVKRGLFGEEELDQEGLVTELREVHDEIEHLDKKIEETHADLGEKLDTLASDINGHYEND